ncbi:WhiB family transcriptional regulator [Zhihengliuella sp.]|uniref:WhiB family transcriptional regulator n=1 Tax=Zhihengliuella sp. TaxID=1954483 RepID=UPI002810CC62|nr:WhiB family transcriptional regulator [Zhihengliuella sp.]
MAELRTARLSNVGAPTLVPSLVKDALADIQSTSARAACRIPGKEDVIDAIFFPHAAVGAQPSGWIEARRICGRCPLADRCLEMALSMEGGRAAAQRFGMFGGKTPTERYNIYKAAYKERRAAEQGE